MRWIRNKLGSQRGASILLALLFFLVCVMVGATVLAAASSNAGRIKELRAKQQEYFTVSSALQLVCDSLEGAGYQAKAEVKEETVEKKPDPDSDLILYTYKKTTYEQKSGTFSTGSTPDSPVNLLPQLSKELDYLFADRFKGEECKVSLSHGEGKHLDDNVHTHSTLGGTSVSAPAGHTLTVQVNDDTSLPADKLPELTEEVEVKVSLGKPGALGKEKYWFFLEAKLKEGGTFVMKAEMKPKGEFPNINNPGTYNGPYPGLTEENRSTLQWELERIYKEFEYK